MLNYCGPYGPVHYAHSLGIAHLAHEQRSLQPLHEQIHFHCPAYCRAPLPLQRNFRYLRISKEI